MTEVVRDETTAAGSVDSPIIQSRSPRAETTYRPDDGETIFTVLVEVPWITRKCTLITYL